MTVIAIQAGGNPFSRDLVSSRTEQSQPQLLNVYVVDEIEQCVVYVVGEVDTSTHEQLAAAIELAVRSGRVRVVLDMADVAFIDSSGLRVLTIGRRRAFEAGGSLLIRAASEAVIRLLTLTASLDKFVSSAPS